MEASRRQAAAEAQQRFENVQSETRRSSQEAIAQRERLQRELAEAQSKLNGRENAGNAQIELMEALPTMPKELQDFTESLLKIAGRIDATDTGWLTKQLKSLDQFVYQPAPQPARLARRSPEFNDLIRLHQIGLIQRWAHEELERQNIKLLDPAPDTPFDVKEHRSDEQHLVWATLPEKDNQVHSVVRVGFKFREKVLRQAVVKKYVYLHGTGRGAVTLDEATVEESAPDDEVLSAIPENALTSGGEEPIADNELVKHHSQFNENNSEESQSDSAHEKILSGVAGTDASLTSPSEPEEPIRAEVDTGAVQTSVELEGYVKDSSLVVPPSMDKAKLPDVIDTLILSELSKSEPSKTVIQETTSDNVLAPSSAVAATVSEPAVEGMQHDQPSELYDKAASLETELSKPKVNWKDKMDDISVPKKMPDLE